MILYCDCFSGISGDMFLGGLVDLGLPIDLLQEELTKLKISFLIQAEKVTKRAIQATQVIITDPEEHHHHTITQTTTIIIDQLRVGSYPTRIRSLLFY